MPRLYTPYNALITRPKRVSVSMGVASLLIFLSIVSALIYLLIKISF